MEINCGSVSLTTLKPSLLMTGGGEAALVALLVSDLVKAQLAAAWLTQREEFMKLLSLLLTNQHRHTPCSSEPVDAETNGGTEDGDEDEDNDDDDGESDDDNDDVISPNDGYKSGAKNHPNKENVEGEDDVEEPNEDDDDDEEDEDDGGDEDDDDDEDDDNDDDDDNDGSGEDDEEEVEEDEDEDEDEEDIQPPKKRKK
ncbi:hypothetical protein OROHE_024268 [Orobanche hederae]